MMNFTKLLVRFNIQYKVSCKFLLTLCIVISVDVFGAKEVDVALVTEHFPPYQIVDQNNVLSGFTTELMIEVMKRSQYRYSINAYPWTVAYNFALKKPNHCIFSIARLSSRENLFTWIGRITENNKAIVWGLKNKQNYKISSLEDIKKYTTAVKRNNAPHQALLEMGFSEGINLYVLDNSNALINILYSRSEIDFIVADDITISYRAKLAGIDINQLHKEYEISNLWSEFYLACNKNTNQKVIDNLTLIIDEIHKDGTYQRLLGNWKNKMSYRK
ncbi:substrate-binding periplasmic protein [Colwellia sp. 12G3]|uniref:substrate-binding periplasmic protein n=1 Tax=Colwellia sp. 12G3 TaxID=2058299 RepID=UPI0012FF4F2F|nr:transporter substrate-binding domain-containing protein [Colwellia sp. 12G3]